MKLACSPFTKWRSCCTFRFPGSMEGRASVAPRDCQASAWENIGAFGSKKSMSGSRPSVEPAMLLDTQVTLGGDIGKGGRANHSKERRRMARCQYQNGCLFIRGKRRKVWVARWRENVMLADGSASRVMRSVVLGPVSQIAGRREARKLLYAYINPVNQGQYRPEATMSFSKFVTECFEPGILPTLKYATREIYSFLLRKHLTPQFGDKRLCDISRVEIQQYLLKKLRQGFAWETTNHLRNLMGKVLGTAVTWNYLADNAVRGVKMPERSLKRPHQFLNIDEVQRLIAAYDEPTRTIVLLATMTGLRIGEILALRWSRINFIKETLSVAETCYKGKFGTPKTKASRREVPLSPAVLEALKTQYTRSADRSPEGLVFATRNGGPLVSNN